MRNDIQLKDQTRNLPVICCQSSTNIFAMIKEKLDNMEQSKLKKNHSIIAWLKNLYKRDEWNKIVVAELGKLSKVISW